MQEHETTLDQLSNYLDGLSLETIVRIQDPAYRITRVSPEDRKSLLIDGEEVERRRRSATHKGKLSNWVMWQIVGSRHLTGEFDTTNSFQTTSTVMAIAHDHSCAFTRTGSVYELADECDQPSSDVLINVVATLNVWGAGRALGLPAIYY